MGEAHSLTRNTLAQVAPTFIAYLCSFAAGPIVVSGLGLRMFGIWAFTGALAQYGGLLDLGVGRSLSRFVAANQDDRRVCGEYLALGFVSVVAVLVILVLAAVLSAPLFASLLGGISVPDMRIVLVSSAGLVACTMATVVITSYPVGLRRMVIPNFGVALGAIVNFGASVAAIIAGARLPGYALANLGAGLVTVGLVAAMVLWAEGKIPVAIPRRARARDFLGFGLKFQLAWAMELLNYQSDKIVIGIAVGPAAAGSYELANRVAAAARQIGILPSTALLPTATAEFGRFGLSYLRNRYRRFTTLVTSMAFPLLCLVGALGPLLLGAWLGHVPPGASVVLLALTVPYLASVSADVTKVVAGAAGLPRVVARVAVWSAVVNLALTAALAPAFGLWGVLAGTVVALTAGALVQVALVTKQFGLPRHSYLSAVLPPLRLCVLLAIPLFVVAYSGLIHGRAAQAVVALALGAIYIATYLVISVRAGRVPTSLVRRLPLTGRLVTA